MTLRPVRLCITGIPGSGKTTTTERLARYFEVSAVHSSRIAKELCPGDWIELGEMAPEPCTTQGVEEVLADKLEWIIDGFPRSKFQLRSPAIYREAIVYLDVSVNQAMKRLRQRNRAAMAVEQHRIRDQLRILQPVRQLAAVVIPTTFRDPDEVVAAVIRWYEDEVQPSELGSNAR